MDISTLTISGAYFYPRDSETLSERKSADFCRKMTAAGDSPWLLPQALTDSKEDVSREPMGAFCGGDVLRPLSVNSPFCSIL